MNENRFINAGGVKTRYWSKGHGGVPFVLLHGLGGTVEDWGETIETLAQDRRVIAIDLLGNGLTEKPHSCEYLPDQMRDHILHTLDALELSEVDLNGWSLGGRIAINLAHAYPQRVRRLILTAPAGIGRDTIVKLDAPFPNMLWQLATQPAESGVRILRNALRSGGGKRLFEFSKRRFVFISEPEARTVFVRQLRSFIGPSGYLEGPRQTLLTELKDLTLPALAIWGRQDNFVPMDHFAILEECLPQVRLYAIENCGHTPHIEWPDIYAEAVHNFLCNTDA